MPQALLTDTAIAPLSWCSVSLGWRWKTAGAAHSSAPSQQPRALLGKLPHPPALGLQTSLTSSKIHSPSSTSTPDNDNICFGPEHPGLLTPIFFLSLCDRLLHFIYYSSWMFRFKILLCMWALYMQSIISPWIWGCWVGEGRKKEEKLSISSHFLWFAE